MGMYDNLNIFVVIPAFNEEEHIVRVVESIPAFVKGIVAVDDGSSDTTLEKLSLIKEPRLIVISHGSNQGVGGATISGFRAALDKQADIIVKVDGDGQMDTRLLPKLLDPLVHGGYHYAKGNRFLFPTELGKMPKPRLIGNFMLTFLIKLSSGYWKVFDPQNGYVAIKSEALKFINLTKIAPGYFFENDLLIHLNIHNFRVIDVPMPAIYADEKSSMKISRVLLGFPCYLIQRFWYRIYHKYILRDFSPIGLFYLLGALLLTWGVFFGGYTWWHALASGSPATTGTVMASVLPFLVGFQMVLQAISLEINETPK